MKKNEIVIGSIAIIIIGLFFLLNNYYCLAMRLFDFKNLNIDTNIKKIILLYGDSPCNTCYFGKQMLAIKNNKDIVIYVPNDYSNYDIKNLKIF